jgi:hypothetical protein
MVQISRKDLERLAIGFGIADFLTEGRLSAPIARGTKAALKRAAPAIARGLIRYGPTVAVTAARVTPTPLAAAAVGAAAVQNRELITDVAGNVYERVKPGVQAYGEGVMERLRDPDQFIPVGSGQQPALEKVFGLPSGKPRRKVRSKFNQAVKAGMAAVKNSTSYGKKGTINNAKRAFSAVTKVASKVNKGKKVATKGVTGTIARAVRKIL